MNEDQQETAGLNRRTFLQTLGAVPLALAATGCDGSNNGVAGLNPAAAQVTTFSGRQQQALNFRTNTAIATAGLAAPNHVNNGDEQRYPNGIATFTKTLPHNSIGEVDPSALAIFLGAFANPSFEAFENIPAAGTARLANPSAGLTLQLEGHDPLAVTMPPAPTFDSAQSAGEMVELYWMALTRDVPFLSYGTDPTVAAAIAELNALGDFRGARSGGSVTPATVFRGILNGDLLGPYVSQFLVQPFSWGAIRVDPRVVTGPAGVDYMTQPPAYLAIQNGQAPPAQQLLPTPRYISNMRDLANYVHVDAVSQPYVQAALILLSSGVPLNPGNPFNLATRQGSFVNSGPAQILSLVPAVAARALAAVWYQKWFVHRRLRPEVFGARAHFVRTGQAAYPIHADLLNSQALARIFANNGTYFLPIAYPEGSPTHPAYGAGHAVIAAACTTMLKAFFDGGATVPNPVEASADGSALLPFAGSLTVEGELNKLCSNMSVGRNGAGMHYQTDYSNCIGLGEAVALQLLREIKSSHPEDTSFTLSLFGGSSVTV